MSVGASFAFSYLVWEYSKHTLFDKLHHINEFFFVIHEFTFIGYRWWIENRVACLEEIVSNELFKIPKNKKVLRVITMFCLLPIMNMTYLRFFCLFDVQNSHEKSTRWCARRCRQVFMTIVTRQVRRLIRVSLLYYKILYVWK